jgi:hypothetical protein
MPRRIDVTSDEVVMKASVWNSLEVAKLATTIVFTIVGGIFTLVTYNRQEIQKRQAQDEENFRRSVELRTQIWREASPMLNDIYVYFEFVGKFKELSPEDILTEKRDVDRLMYANRAFFNKDDFDAYEAFIGSTFSPYQGWLKDAKLRTVPVRPLDTKNTNTQDDRFTNEDNRDCINRAYWNLQRATVGELGLAAPTRWRTPPVPSGAPGLGSQPTDTCPVADEH